MNIQTLVAGKDVCRLAFIGGSITEGAGSTDYSRRWTTRLTALLAAAYPATRFEEINAGISGTESTYGLLRLERDVLRFVPDIVFVEFSLNDQAIDEALSSKAYEGMLRTLMNAPGRPAVVLVGAVGNTQTRTRAVLHREIGAHYGLRLIDLQQEMDEELGAAAPGSNPARDVCFIADNVHPTDAGHEYYARHLFAHFDEDIFHSPQGEKRDPEAFDFTGRFLNAAELPRTGEWTLCGQGDWNAANCGPADAGIYSESPAAALTLTFRGSAVIVGERIGERYGRLAVTLDGERRTVELFYHTENQPVTWYQRFDLTDGEHTLVLSPAGEKHPESTGTGVKLDFVCIPQ